jgi:S1-C subfamily serine protease
MFISCGFQNEKTSYSREMTNLLLERIGLKLSVIGRESCLQTSGAVCVLWADPTKAAAKSGLRENDLIEEINDIEIRSWEDLEKSLSKQSTALPVRFLVRRYNSIRNLAYLAVWCE